MVTLLLYFILQTPPVGFSKLPVAVPTSDLAACIKAAEAAIIIHGKSTHADSAVCIDGRTGAVIPVFSAKK